MLATKRTRQEATLAKARGAIDRERDAIDRAILRLVKALQPFAGGLLSECDQREIWALVRARRRLG